MPEERPNDGQRQPGASSREDLRSTDDRDPSMAPYQEPLDPALTRDEPVVETNVQNSMSIRKGEGTPVARAAGTDATSPGHWRTSMGILVAIVVALLLALPVLWGLVELFTLVGVIGPWIWAWAVSLVAILVLTVVIGYRIAKHGM